MDIIKKIAPYIEILVAVNIGIVLSMSTAENKLSILMVLSVSILSLLYLFLARMAFSSIGTKISQIIEFVNYLGLATTLVGILLVFNQYSITESKIVLSAGSILVVISMLGILFTRKEQSKNFFHFKLPLMRSALILLLALSISLMY